MALKGPEFLAQAYDRRAWPGKEGPTSYRVACKAYAVQNQKNTKQLVDHYPTFRINGKAMSQSLCQLFIHLIFSTKQRERYISPEIEKELNNYLGQLCLKLDTFLITAGGDDDHLHLLIRFTKNSTVSGFLSIIKMQSSRWLKSNFKSCEKFAWQNGYGAFSVDVTRVDQIKKYISNQREHHRRVSFQDEFRKILVDHGVDFNERYLWD